tara:strand:- start:71911 stop:72237 length:327 start_codon:yes stop_codon:yes gene_type:complete
MKKTGIELLEEIQQLTKKELNYRNGRFQAEESFSLTIPVKGYEHLFFIIDSLLSVCHRALTGENIPEHREANLDIATALELVQSIMPQEEGLYLDRMRDIFPKDETGQ